MRRIMPEITLWLISFALDERRKSRLSLSFFFQWLVQDARERRQSSDDGVEKQKHQFISLSSLPGPRRYPPTRPGRSKRIP